MDEVNMDYHGFILIYRKLFGSPKYLKNLRKATVLNNLLFGATKQD